MERSLLVDFLCIIFGLGSWITVNGVWVELPQLVTHLPEGWNLPSYLAIIVQLSNIGPVAYTLVHVVKPSPKKDLFAVSITTIIGSTACLLLVFFWRTTVYFYDSVHSVPLFVLVFFMALVDCTSSVIFLPFMSLYKEKYMVSYLVGEGLSGFIPSVLALIQDVGGNPECRNATTNGTNLSSAILEPYYPEPSFTTSSFFGILFVMDVSSLLAFFLLNFLPTAKSEMTPLVAGRKKISSYVAGDESPSSASETDHSLQLNEQSSPEQNFNDSSGTHVTINRPTSMPMHRLIFLLLLQAWACTLTNGVMTSVQSFSALPYGNRAFQLSVTLSTMANPLACCIAFLLPTRKASIATIFIVAGSTVSCYLMATASLSPHPPLQGQIKGEVLVVAAWILFVGLMSYAKACIITILREEGRNALFWCGVSTQAGSAIGALIMFLLVNVYKLFQSYNPCES